MLAFCPSTWRKTSHVMSFRAFACASLVAFGASACSSSSHTQPVIGGSGSAVGSGTGTSGAAAATGGAGTPTGSGTAGQGTGTSGQAGGSTAGAASGGGGTGASVSGAAMSSGGSAGASSTGAATGSSTGAAASGMSMSGTASSGIDPGDTPPWRPLNVTAPPAQYIHQVDGYSAGVDTRATPIGKLAVDIGVNSGSYSPWLGMRGYHSMGAPCGNCAAPNLGAGRDVVGTCRMGEFAMTQAHVLAALTSMAQQFPSEDWGYFLNQDGSVRWSDVAITGMSHGATTAAVAGRIGVRMWRVVSRSGPRDDTCGVGVSPTPTFDPANPPWMANCPLADIASWMDMPTMTPMDRFYGLVGTTDVEYGDIMFDMNRTLYPGPPVQWNVAGAVLTGNQFYSTEGGHLDWLEAANVPINTNEALNIAFAIPAANQNPNF
jgi:hypothetical protein